MAGLVVINFAYSLNVSAPPFSIEINSWRFPTRCPTRKRQRKRPVRAITYFFERDDLSNPLLLMVIIYAHL